MARPDFVPALGFRSLTRLYDPVVALVTRERTFKERLLKQAKLKAGQRVLDLACGTGTLAVQLGQRWRGVRLIGVDVDPEVLAHARRKANEAGIDLPLQRARAQSLPFADASFHRVLSTLFFHHLDATGKDQVLREVVRVLRPGGELHAADWGKPTNPFLAGMFLFTRLLDGFENTRDNVQGRLPHLFRRHGLKEVRVRARLGTVAGTMTLYSGRKPG